MQWWALEVISLRDERTCRWWDDWLCHLILWKCDLQLLGRMEIHSIQYDGKGDCQFTIVILYWDRVMELGRSHFRIHQYDLCLSCQWMHIAGFYSFLILVHPQFWVMLRGVIRKNSQSTAWKDAIWLVNLVLLVFTCHHRSGTVGTSRRGGTVDT